MRVVRQRVREDGTPETEKDLLDWLKYAQSETTGIKLGFSKGEVAEMDAQIDAALRELVDEEVNRRLAARGLTVQVQHAEIGQPQIRTKGHSPRDARTTDRDHRLEGSQDAS